MSQHDMDVANGSGAVVRVDINAALQALASLSSGASAPSPSFPSQLWADIGTSRLKRRNAANSAWVDEGPLDATLRDAALQGGFVTDTGSANAYVCNFVPAITARSESTPLRFKVTNANTTSATINDGIGVVALVGAAHSALQGGELIANGIAWIQWNSSVGGGSYVLLFCTGAPQQVADAAKAKHAVTAGQLVAQSMTAFTTAGTAPSFTLTPVPAIAAYTAGQRFRVKFHAGGTGSDTLNVSALGTKTVKQYDSSGTKVAANIASGQLTDVEYDGTDMVVLTPLPTLYSVGKAGDAKALFASATGTNATVTVTAEELVVESSANTFLTLRPVSVAPTFATAGANGIDVGAANSQAAGQWYSVWVIWNGTTVAGLLSLSATAPTMPSGYTHKARVGWVITDLTANKYPLRFDQAGRKVTISPAAGTNVSGNMVMAQGVQGTINGSGISVSVNSFIPSTAWAIEVLLSTSTGAGGTVQVGRTGNLSNSIILSITNEANQATSCMVGLDGTSRNLVFASTLSVGVLISRGWEDNL